MRFSWNALHSALQWRAWFPLNYSHTFSARNSCCWGHPAWVHRPRVPAQWSPSQGLSEVSDKRPRDTHILIVLNSEHAGVSCQLSMSAQLLTKPTLKQGDTIPVPSSESHVRSLGILLVRCLPFWGYKLFSNITFTRKPSVPVLSLFQLSIEMVEKGPHSSP